MIRIADVIEPRVEKALPQDHLDLPFIGLDDVEAHTMRLLGEKSASELKSAAKRFYPGDVLYSRLRPYLNKVWCATHQGICSSEFIVLPGNEHVDPKFLALRLNALDFVSFANSLNAGDRPRVDFDQISSFFLPAFSLHHQRRIVAKIEELFSELEKGIESLKTAREQLKLYRQAILKHAFEGKLTARWREENKDKLETPEQIVERIQKEREANYQQQLAELKVSSEGWSGREKEGRKLVKPRKPANIHAYFEPDFPELPQGWIWLKYGDMCSLVRNGISEKPMGSDGAKIFRISAVRPMKFALDDYRHVDNSDHRYNEYYLKYGDIVFTRYNGSRAYVGVCAEYKSDGSHLFPDKLIQTRLAASSLVSSYMEGAINCGASRHFIEQRMRTTAGQSGVSGADIKSIPVPICSRNEQEIIVEYINQEISRSDHLLKEIDVVLERSYILRQSILKKAFSGRLVPQDPDDEPATALLERIRAEKAAQAETNKPKVKRQPRRRRAEPA